MELCYKRTKYACYYTYLATASIFSMPPILFTTFRQMYGISYTLLGTLILTNFCTQLAVDLIFSFFSKHLDPHKALRLTPLITSLGLLVYALVPMLLPQYAYAGLFAGTVIFSVSAGLAEVLISPTVAALPSEHPKKDMANLHSLYGYGVVMVVIISTLYLELFGHENWMYLAIFWAILPVIATVVLCKSPMPQMQTEHRESTKNASKRNTGLILCMLCIFFGGATENSMANWVSTFIEGALQIPKAVGDLLGLCIFAMLLALTRSAYAKYGKNISRFLIISMVASVFCYLIAGLSPIPVISMIGCVLTGIFASMLWPGTLIYMEENIPNAGVAAYALMAAGGDFGSSVAPQALGVIMDQVSVSPWAISISTHLGISAEQVGMKIGMLAAALFPLVGVAMLLALKKHFKSNK